MLRQPVTAVLLLFACQFGGELIAQTLKLPLPGPVIGMLLLLTTLAATQGRPTGLNRVTAPLLAHMSLLFIPAGAGVIAYRDLISAEWTAIVAAIAVSTLVALLTTAGVFLRLQAARQSPEMAPQSGSDRHAIEEDNHD